MRVTRNSQNNFKGLTMKLTSVKVFIILIIASAANAYNYCQLCSDHIACENNGNWASTCPSNAQLISLNNNNKQTALNSHNSARDTVARGGVAKLSTASKMMTLVSFE